jgi:hypothetical protein
MSCVSDNNRLFITIDTDFQFGVRFFLNWMLYLEDYLVVTNLSFKLFLQLFGGAESSIRCPLLGAAVQGHCG